MGEFNIKTSKEKSAISALKSDARSVAALYNTVSSVNRNLGIKIKTRVQGDVIW